MSYQVLACNEHEHPCLPRRMSATEMLRVHFGLLNRSNGSAYLPGGTFFVSFVFAALFRAATCCEKSTGPNGRGPSSLLREPAKHQKQSQNFVAPRNPVRTQNVGRALGKGSSPSQTLGNSSPDGETIARSLEPQKRQNPKKTQNPPALKRNAGEKSPHHTRDASNHYVHDVNRRSLGRDLLQDTQESAQSNHISLSNPGDGENSEPGALNGSKRCKQRRSGKSGGKWLGRGRRSCCAAD